MFGHFLGVSECMPQSENLSRRARPSLMMEEMHLVIELLRTLVPNLSDRL
jgi:hypothetical protein